jgi:hypothetical protein
VRGEAVDGQPAERGEGGERTVGHLAAGHLEHDVDAVPAVRLPEQVADGVGVRGGRDVDGGVCAQGDGEVPLVLGGRGGDDPSRASLAGQLDGDRPDAAPGRVHDDALAGAEPGRRPQQVPGGGA